MYVSNPSLLSVTIFSLQVFSQGTGQWGDLITFPLVPVAAALIPGTGKLLTWSAYSTTTYSQTASGITQTATYNTADGSITSFTVQTGHDMFCPGISFDFQGNLIITGGDTAPATTEYVKSSATWVEKADMNIPRGYQSSATMSNGQVFVIGGSWSGGGGGKNGEIWDGKSWTLKSGCPVAAMLTNDPAGIFRSDNHGWLFGWKNASVLQAGPSKEMHWYYPTVGSTGSYADAGPRGSDGDAMCGPAVMFDAVAGKILAVGGSPAYSGQNATANANLLTVGAPGAQINVQGLPSMHFKRIFATSTVLPDGKVLIVGGQVYGIPFSDDQSIMTPELWDPSTHTFSLMAQQGAPRNYHSVSILMEDGRVFNGGGGLCGSCGTNHLNGQFFSPPYLFQADGHTPATRPSITAISATTVKVGNTITVTLNSGSGTVSFSMMRYGTSTHTVNTDQRRVPLTPTSTSGTKYTFTLPSDPGILLPGYWMFFALRGGVPSVAKTVLVTL